MAATVAVRGLLIPAMRFYGDGIEHSDPQAFGRFRRAHATVLLIILAEAVLIIVSLTRLKL